MTTVVKYSRAHSSEKSLYRNPTGRRFYGTENEIWAGFGPVGNTEKKVLGQLRATFEGSLFMFSGDFFSIFCLKIG